MLSKNSQGSKQAVGLTKSGIGRGLMGISDSSDLPARLLKANDDFMGALANSYIRDELQRNGIIIYAAQLKMFGMVDELEDLTCFLNGSLSINMASRAQALQAGAGMVFPSISGMKVAKQELKMMEEVNKEAVRAKHYREEKDEENRGEV